MTDQLPITADEPLPGMGEGPEQRGGPTELQAQVRRSLRFLVEQRLVDERHAGHMQLALELAARVRPGERAYGIAQVGAQLLATLDKLMPEEGGGGDGFDELRAFIAGVDAAGGSAALRDPS